MIKKRLVGLLSHAKKYIGLQVFWQWLALIAQMTAVFSIAGLLENVLYGTVDAADWQKTVVVLAVCIALRFVCERQAAAASYKASVDVKKILRQKIYDKMLRLGPAYREWVSTSEVMQVSTEGVEQLETYFGRYLPQLFYSLLAPVTLFVVLCRVSMKASVVLLICVPLIPISIVAVQKIAKKLLNKYWSIYTGLGDSFLENLQGLTTLKIYQADEKKADEMDEEAQTFRRITMKVLTMQLNSTSVMDIVAYGGAAVGMIVAVSEFLAGRLGFAGCVTIVLLASEFFIPLRLLGSFFHIAMNGMAASDKIFAILDLPEPEAGQVELDEVLCGGASADSVTGAEEGVDSGRDIEKSGFAVKFENVHFSYEKEREILKGISFEVPVGNFVALAGESGCGKSTIAGILSGKNHGFSGKVTIGGVTIGDIAEESLMKNVTLVRHNSYLFKGTVEENLRMAKPDATEAEMRSVLGRMNLMAFLDAQDGLQTQLQEQAGNLSGGQKQRLGLARALLHDSPIYIFDEATSNIDVESEEMIMEVIRELAKTKTVILISHRLANVVEADCIYMMKNGEFVEQGVHKELLKRNGYYAELFERQRVLEEYAESSGNTGEKRKSENGGNFEMNVNVENRDFGKKISGDMQYGVNVSQEK
ncbi:ABC transporter ATP-binding protein/permease [Blautia sp. MSJ-19]|uniref:ABC transporter ATP-binding protein/permease n=1 Tax=Blautia sp. MSJ-19 TaxID=2841517 RepID=UPI001C0E9012|nr:ABC transporter ATP-binding protein/permease [Blautia sp. MSJ-19]MBU5480379.1 ABC transporter ATP-binding protein/permease [Blautia sp. MSJ-19]